MAKNRRPGFPIRTEFPVRETTPKQETSSSKPASGLDAERLWETYSIKEDWPSETKIELLIIMWKLKPDQISEILGLDLTEVQGVVTELENSWRDLGRPLSPEERELERGRQIAELERLRSQLEEAYIINKDPKFLTQKANVLERLAKLRGIEQEKPVSKDDKDPGTTLKDRIDQLPAARHRELLDRLRNKES